MRPNVRGASDRTGMNPIHVLGDADTVLAFALGGIPGRAVSNAAEARAAIESVSRESAQHDGPERRPVLVLVTQRTAALIGDDLQRMVLDPRSPLVVEIPGFAEPSGERPVQRFVQRVLGVRL